MFYKPYPISRSKIILSNPHPLVITGSRIKLIGHFSFCNKFAIYACHESVCIFPKRECHLREKDHHRDHSCNYIPALTTIKDWHTKAYCHSPSKCLLLNMNSNYLNRGSYTALRFKTVSFHSFTLSLLPFAGLAIRINS